MKKTTIIAYCLLLTMVSIVGIMAQKAKTHPAKEYSSLVLANINAITGSEAAPGEEGGDGGPITNPETGGNNGPITNEETGQNTFDYPTGKPRIFDCDVYLDKDFWGYPIRCKAKVVICEGGGQGCNEKDCPAHPSRLKK